MFKKLGNIANLLRQAQQMGSKMQGVTDQLRTQRASGSSGGGMVQVEVNGLGDVLRLTIDPALTDREMIEDLVPAAVNQALNKAKQLHVAAMQSLAAGFDVPGLDEALGQVSEINGEEEDEG
jgi:DNA-binding YbaB/EbfC family protein